MRDTRCETRDTNTVYSPLSLVSCLLSPVLPIRH
jgi:hypothetical protein